MQAAEIVAKAPPDGYTLMVTASAEVALDVALFPRMPYGPVRDFAPITLATVTPMALVVHPSVPVTCWRNTSRTQEPSQARWSSIPLVPGPSTSSRASG